jgi:hypothetical protein
MPPTLPPRNQAIVVKNSEKKGTGGLTWRSSPVSIPVVEVMSTDKATAGAICQEAVLHRPMASVEETKTTPNQVVHLRCPSRFRMITRPHPLWRRSPLDIRGCIGRVLAGLTQRLLFDNPVDCIRQPK